MKQQSRQSCQELEVEISAMIDSELPVSEALVVVDHLLECRECREFYQLARGIESALDDARVCARSGELPVGLWSRIDSTLHAEPAADDDQDGGRSNVVALPWVRRPLAVWVLKVAAMLLVVACGWLALRQALLPRPSATDDVIRVRLESDQGAMTDERFIELTAELLRSDRRYHQKMLEIMAALADRTNSSEGYPDPRLAVPIGDDSGLRRSSNELEAPEKVRGRT